MRIPAKIPSLLPALILLSLLVGCSETAPTGPTDLLAPSLARVTPGHGEPGEVLPFRLDASAVFLGQDFAPDFGPPLFGKSDFGGRCSAASDFVIRFAVSGQAAHLGRFTGTTEHCTQIDFQVGVSTVSDGMMTLTTPVGDELHATYLGAPGPGGLVELVTFMGGTGRFAEATGDAVAHPDCDQSTGTCVLTMEGVIDYEGSSAANR